MLDILIKNGAVVDGTGKPAFKADVGIAVKVIDFRGNEVVRVMALDGAKYEYSRR